MIGGSLQHWCVPTVANAECGVIIAINGQGGHEVSGMSIWFVLSHSAFVEIPIINNANSPWMMGGRDRRCAILLQSRSRITIFAEDGAMTKRSLSPSVAHEDSIDTDIRS